MNTPSVEDALAALARLLQRHVLTPDEGRSAARALTGNPDFEFPTGGGAGPGGERPAGTE